MRGAGPEVAMHTPSSPEDLAYALAMNAAISSCRAGPTRSSRAPIKRAEHAIDPITRVAEYPTHAPHVHAFHDEVADGLAQFALSNPELWVGARAAGTMRKMAVYEASEVQSPKRPAEFLGPQHVEALLFGKPGEAVLFGKPGGKQPQKLFVVDHKGQVDALLRPSP